LKIQNFVKNPNFGQKSKFWFNIPILVKKYFTKKSKCLENSEML